MARAFVETALHVDGQGTVRLPVRLEEDILGHVDDMKRGAKSAGELARVHERGVGGLAEVDWDQDVLERDHCNLRSLKMK